MALDPRRFTVTYCEQGQVKNASATDEKRSFFNQLGDYAGKIGDVELLNRVGGGQVAQGLRDLAGLSDSIRTGDTESALIPNSAGYVFDAVGINPGSARKAGEFNPEVLNRATGAAEDIISRVRTGQFKLSDADDYAQDLQNLGQLASNIFTDEEPTPGSIREVCGATPYAWDIVQYAPKFKFLFIVQIMMKPQYDNMNDSGKILAFVVKNATRPNINIEHEEVNMYNFYTRVPKRVVYEPVTMRFYDDNQGWGHYFYTQYLENISPLSREGGMKNSGMLSIDYLQAHSMGKNSVNATSTASITALEGENTSIIDEIRLFHIYDYGKFMNVYHFHHPKILAMNLDDLDMTDTGPGNEIEFQIAYDALHITPALSMQEKKDFVEQTTTTAGGRYPMRPVFDPAQDITPPQELDLATGETARGKEENTFTDLYQSASTTISNAFSTAAAFAGSIFD
jgi:hypothetical protein